MCRLMVPFVLSIILMSISSLGFSATIKGKVTDTQQQPIINAEVSIKGTNQLVYTNEQGEYIINNIELAHAHLHVYSIQHIHGDRYFENMIGTIESDFVLEKANIDNIVVTANSMQASVLESVAPVSVLFSEELRRQQQPTLGETLKSTPGVHSTYFGPVSSSPIIRGTDGPRVKIVQNGMDVSDASRIGPDHNVSAEVSSATQIEILRGPATLQYGSGAIGGVVNIVDQRIPTQLPDTAIGEVEIRYDTVSNEQFAKLDFTAALNQFALHLDAFDRVTDDYEIPGFAEREPDDENPGTLENSAIDSDNLVAGLSYITDQGYIGFSVQDFNNFYGVPGHHGEHHEEEILNEADISEEELVNLQVDMQRYQLATEWFSPLVGIDQIQFSTAYTDYQHTELEGDEIGTIFENETYEAKASLHHQAIRDWHGVLGVDYSIADYAALGEEAFTPPNTTKSVALYLIEEKKYNDITVQLGGRIEETQLNADPITVELNEHKQTFSFSDLNFTSVSFSAGANWVYQPGYSIALSLARSERAPSQQELFSAGQHLSTQTFDLGRLFTLNNQGEIIANDENVQEEVSTNIDLTWRKFTGDWGIVVSTFYNEIDDYLYQENTGLVAADHDEHSILEEEEEGLPLFIFRQEDADLYGFEAELHYQINPIWKAKLLADKIYAEITTDNLPRIPPLRLGADLQFDLNNWYGNVEINWYDRQTRTAAFETETSGYALVNLGLNYGYQSNWIDWTIFLRMNNLFDREARVHSSFLKEQTPLPGRGVVLGVRANF